MISEGEISIATPVFTGTVRVCTALSNGPDALLKKGHVVAHYTGGEGSGPLVAHMYYPGEELPDYDARRVIAMHLPPTNQYSINGGTVCTRIVGPTGPHAC